MSVRGVGRLLCMAMAAVVLVAGCGQQSTGPASPGNTADSADELTPNPLPPGTEVLAPYYPRAIEQNLMDNAQEILLAQCLGGKRGSTEAPRPGDLKRRLAEEKEADSAIYGITDLDLARRFGYSPSPDLVPAEAPSDGDIQPLPPYIELPPEVTATDPNKPSPAPDDTTWCVRAAQAELFGGEQYAGTDPFALGHRLYVEAWLKSQDDPRVKAAWADWRDCMVGKALTPKGSPINPELFPIRVGGEQAPADEVAAALADIACKEQVRLVARWAEVVTELEQVALAKHWDQLDPDRKHLAETIQRAESITSR